MNRIEKSKYKKMIALYKDFILKAENIHIAYEKM